MPKGSSGVGRLPNYKKAVIPRNKVREFYLKPGAKHYDEFVDVGYTTRHYARLEGDLKKGLAKNSAVNRREDRYGNVRYDVYMELGVTRKKTFLTVWQILRGTKTPQIITAYRSERK